MFINPLKLIVFRNGTPLVINVSGSAQSIVIGDADFFLLDLACQTNDMGSFLAAVKQHSIINSVFTTLNASKITNRIEQYKTAKILLDTPVANPPEIVAQPINSEIVKSQSILNNKEYRVSKHFAISFSENGFAVWSSRENTFIKLHALEALILSSFGDGNTLQDVFESKSYLPLSLTELQTLASNWHSAGLLVEKRDFIQSAKEALVPFATKTPSRAFDQLNWQQVSADNRIPVYFVPHMENHFPLALGVLFSAIANYEDGRLLNEFQLLPLNYMEPNELFNGPYRKFGPGIWLFSNYMWSIDLNMQISQAVKQHDKKNFTIHGGPSTPDYQQACEDFLNEHQHVDVAVHGEGEVTITDILQCVHRSNSFLIDADEIQLSKVPGITYREDISKRLIRTGSRERMKNPDNVPSPYLSGIFDNYQGRIEAAIIETNRGCPYGCTFCDWGSATNQKIRKFDLERVKDEISWIGKNKVRVLWIADANYGLYDRDIEISQFIVDTKKRYGYPQEIVVNYTKNSTWRLVEIIKIFSAGSIIGQGIISIQTTDEKTLDVINRKNIRTQRYDELAQAFTDLNLPLSTDLMIGLPGMTVDSFKADLQKYIDMDVSVKAYPTQLLPNSPMADPEYIAKYKIKTDEHSFLISSYSYTPTDHKHMSRLYEVYTMAEGYGLLRYVLRFVQWEYNISAANFMDKLIQDCKTKPDDYPLITWAMQFFNADKSMPSGWEAFYKQVKAYLVQAYAVKENDELDIVLCVSRMSMPDDGLTYPVSVHLKHDFVRYFKQFSAHQSDNGPKLPLGSFEPCMMQFSDPNKLSVVDLDEAQYDTHQYFWELHSEVARPKSQADFAD